MSSASAGKFVVREFDDFTDKTTVRHKNVLSCGAIFDGSSTVNKYAFRLRQVKTNDLEAICLDCEIQAKDWFHARNGRVIFNCDQQNFRVDFSETSSKADHIGDTLYCFENGHYVLTKDELQAICNAKAVKMRIQGDSLYEEPGAKWMLKFQAYCIQFRDDVYPEGRSTESLPSAPAAAPEQKPVPPVTARVSSPSGALSRIATLAVVLVVGVALGMWLWSKFGRQGTVLPSTQAPNPAPALSPMPPPSPVPAAAPAIAENQGTSPESTYPKRAEQVEGFPHPSGERTNVVDNNVTVPRDNGIERQGVASSEIRGDVRAPTSAPPARRVPRIQDGVYHGTLSCGPLLHRADSKGWQTPIELTISGDQFIWRRSDDQFEENGQSVVTAAGIKIDALGYYYPTAPKPGRWRTRGTLTVDNSTLQGAFEQVDPSGDRQNRVCRVVAPVTLER